MGKVLVSAIITTHNRLNLLPRAIESVLKQTYSHIECIVVSDNSDDGTKEYCERRNDIVFIDIPKEESKGGNHARNVGINASHGDYLAFLDDDDYWLPSKIEKQLMLINEKGCKLVFCGRKYEIIRKDELVEMIDSLPRPQDCGDMSKKIMSYICTTTSALLLKKDIIEKVGLFDESLNFWQEYEFLIRAAQKSDFYYVNEPLIVYRVDSIDKNRLTNKYYEWWDAVRYIQKKHQVKYSCLSFEEKRLVKLLIYKDAYMRASNCGLEEEKNRMMRKIKVWGFPEIIKDKVHHHRRKD